jgi:hypothetical protein
MRRLSTLAAYVAVSTIACAGLAVFAAPAFASSGTTNGTGHCDPSDPACGANPVLQGPPPPFVTIPSNCPAFLSSDTWTLNFVSGSSVSHGTTNKNGDWGGFTAQGQAVLATSDGAAQYAGHLTEWGGGGNNAGGQTDGGFTLAFNGSGSAGSLSIHVSDGSTTNNAGTPTGSHQNIKVSCSP